MFKHSVSNYDKEPYIAVEGYEHHVWQGIQSISEELILKITTLQKQKIVVVLDMYHGVFENEIISRLSATIKFDDILSVSTVNHSDTEIDNLLSNNITDDRVFGILSCHQMQHFFNPEKAEILKNKIMAYESGLILVYGIGASFILQGDILIYADMARWEIQQRMRKNEIANWCSQNYKLDYMQRYKRAFFIDWRVLDRHKQNILRKADYLLDTNNRIIDKMITGEAFFSALAQATSRPIRLVPFFDPGIWGGQWMKEVCDLDSAQPNFAWCFDCVPEENSMILKFGEIKIEIPSINLVFLYPDQLLGRHVHARFGLEFPIRFDFLDTMNGDNLSLQVHPFTEYIQNMFGMHYTQDESYYILDAKEDATVYLGLKDSIDSEIMLDELTTAQAGIKPFDANKFINVFPARKHDHFMIPAGTIHCAGKNAMVLEISATPYIFTFKLWDWGRVGLDGLPRPIHLEHGKNVIAWDRTTDWVKENLVNPVKLIREYDGIIEEQTGLHELEFIETRRHWSKNKVVHQTKGVFNVLNLVEGSEAIVESPSNAFEPFVVHYTETFIIPAAVGEYTIRPFNSSIGKEIATIKAYVRI